MVFVLQPQAKVCMSIPEIIHHALADVAHRRCSPESLERLGNELSRCFGMVVAAQQSHKRVSDAAVKDWMERNGFDGSVGAARVAIEDARTLHLL